MTDIAVTELDEERQLFTNSSTLRLFLFMRGSEEPIGTRETQRELGFNSPGTVQWHLDKLRDAGIVEKLPSNRYQLTNRGRNLPAVDLPLEYPFKLVRGQLVPQSNFHLTFSIASLAVLLFSIYGSAPLTQSLFLAQSFMIVHLLLYLWQRLQLRQKLKKFVES